MTPMTKNIIVVDETGKVYEATYPKRAKGLVKNGRARFIDENTICLACPPDQNLEDNIMLENTNTTSEKLTMDYCLQQIETVLNDKAHLTDAFDQLKNVKDAESMAAMALGNIVEAREKTNQRLLDLYQKMYNDLKPRPSLKERALDILSAAAQNESFQDGTFIQISRLLEQINQMAD